MNFIVDYASFAIISEKINGNYDMWQSKLVGLLKTLNKIIASDYLEGAGANNLKQYLKEIHIIIISKLVQLCEIHKKNFALYYVKDYINIDSDARKAKIKSSELDNILKNIETTKKNVCNIDGEITSKLNSISDIFWITRQDISGVINEHEKIIKEINNLKTAIIQVEESHSKNDFVSTESLINSLTALINECISKDRTYKSTYISGTMTQLSSWSEFRTASVKVNEEAIKKEAAYTEAVDIQEKIVADYRKERENNAKYAKWAVWGAGVVLSVAVIAVTGGAATPLVLGTVGAITSAASKVTEDLTEAYVNDGNLKNVKVEDVVVDGVISASTGFISGYVGGSITKFSSKLPGIKNGLNSSSLIVRTATSGLVDAGSDTITGLAERGAEATIEETYDWVASGDEINVKNILGSTFDWKEMSKDFVGGAVSGSTGEIVDTVVSTKGIDHYGLNSDNKIIRGTSGFFVEGGKSVITKGEERFTDSLIDGEGFVEATKSVFDVEEMFKDGISGGAKGAANYTVGNKTVGDELSLKDLEKAETLQKIPTDVVQDPQNWIKNGGKIYMDSHGKVTFEARNMKVNNTILEEPKDKLYYNDSGNADYDRSTVNSSQKVVGAHFSPSKESK